MLCGCFRSGFLEYPKSKKSRRKIIHHNFFHRHSQTSKSSSLERGKNSTYKSVFILFVDSVQKYLCIVIYFSYSFTRSWFTLFLDERPRPTEAPEKFSCPERTCNGASTDADPVVDMLFLEPWKTLL